MSEYNICGVLVHARPGKAKGISQFLEKISGVEIHSVTEDSRIVITVESDKRKIVADTISDFQKVEHVLSASMIYQYSDTDMQEEMSA